MVLQIEKGLTARESVKIKTVFCNIRLIFSLVVYIYQLCVWTMVLSSPGPSIARLDGISTTMILFWEKKKKEQEDIGFVDLVIF